MRTRGDALCGHSLPAPDSPPALRPEWQGTAIEARPGRGLVVLYTGDGKGKTSAALGTLLRARGWRLRVAMYQFVKAATLDGGEHQAARDLGVEILPLGQGFTWDSGDQAADEACARDGWRRCRQALADPAYDAVILDEITYPVCFGWLGADEVLGALRVRPAHQHVILTGRDAPAAWVEAADLVTEMCERKHPHRAGVPAQRGIEF